ncbi:hypothetical protein Btru_058044 [Bulinus truncatus]|nr:hypothetical protein Btru_058044 [Bulinus truncatus]
MQQVVSIRFLVLVVMTTPSLLTVVIEDCPPAWFQHSGFCYNFIFYPELTYQEAMLHCQQDMAYLVSVRTVDEHEFIQDWLKRHDTDGRQWLTSGIRERHGHLVWNSDDGEVPTSFFGDHETTQKLTFDQLTRLENNVIVYKYYATNDQYMLGWSRLMKPGPYICKIHQQDTWKFHQQQRDFYSINSRNYHVTAYGSSSADPSTWEVAPNITAISRDTIFFETRGLTTDVLLDCVATGNPLPEYRWFKKSLFGNIQEWIDPKLHSRYSLSYGRLQIRNPDPVKDSSLYSCVASNKVGTVWSNPVEVGYGYISEFSNVKTNFIDAVLYMGIEIGCDIPIHNTDLQYAWYKSDMNFIRPDLNSQYFLSRNGKFYISEVQAADQGEYFCVVFMVPRNHQVLTESQAPSRTSLGIDLRVIGGTAHNYGPEIMDKFPQFFPEVPMVGDFIELECFAYGRMPLFYSWVRDDGPLNPDAHYRDYSRVLIIPKARLQDTGSYTCIVRGDKNSANKTVHLSLKSRPYFPYPLRNQHLDAGIKFTWTCGAIGIPLPTYTWYKNGVRLTSDPGHGVKVHRNTLTISNVTKGVHEGVYQCEASNSYGSARSGGQLRVLWALLTLSSLESCLSLVSSSSLNQIGLIDSNRSPCIRKTRYFAPTFITSAVEASKTAAEGGNITIACNPHAAPRPAITWLKDGAEVGQVLPSGALDLRSLKRTDQGTYTCVATNELGEARSSCTLYVEERTVFVEKPADVTVEENQTAVIPCKVSFLPGKMDVVYSWIFYSHPIDFSVTSDDRVFYTMPFAQYLENGALYVVAAKLRHTGLYTCVVTTVTGSISASAYLSVRGPPGEPGGVHAKESNDSYIFHNNVDIWWQDGETNGYPVTRYRIEYLSIFEDDWQILRDDIPAHLTSLDDHPTWHGLTVTDGLSPGNAYMFRVSAGNNQVGYGHPNYGPTKWYNMATGPPLYAPENIAGGGGMVGQLQVTWDPLPRSKWGGPNLRYIVYYRRHDEQERSRKWESSGQTVDNFFYTTVGPINYFLLYDVKVQAINDVGVGPNSSVHQVYSAEEMPTRIPGFVSATPINATSSIVTWLKIPDTREDQKGSTLAYTVNYWLEGNLRCFGQYEGNALFNTYYGDVSEGLIVGLEYGGDYCLNIQFINHAGLGPKTDNYGMPMPLAPPNRYPEYITSVRVVWKAVFAAIREESIRGYKAWWWNIQENMLNANITVFGLVSTGVIHGIEKDKIYKLRIFAFSNGGDGKKSPDVFFTLGGQVIYDPNQADILNSAPTSQMIASIVPRTMSKVSFRARALDASKPMPVYKAYEIPDMKDFAQINRSVPQMPTGMEKEEETEHHLQRALSAQQVYGSSEALVIPIPEVQDISERYHILYPDTYKPSKQYVHIQAFSMDQEIPDYDMDSDDDCWLNEQSKKMEITPLKFEEMMDRLEKGSGQQVVTLQEAKLLLKEDDDLIIAVYDYWLNKRLKMQRPLIATVKSEKRDGTTTNNPYVAFRRRTEKMQTRKNRKNDEVSYEKMLKLRRDLQKTLTLLELLKRREKSKKELLQLTIEILEKRIEMEDFSGTALAEAEEEREKHPTFVAPFALNSRGEWVQTYKGEETAPVRKKRAYRKRNKAQQQQQQNQIIPHTSVHHFQHQQHSSGDIDIMDSSDDDILSPALSQSDHEDENDPDGMFAFKRRKYCHYHQPLQHGLGNWPWHGPEEGGRGDKRFRFSLTSLPTGCMAYARRRIGRGGRVIFDRASTPWDETFERLDFGSNLHHSSIYSEYVTYVRENNIPHYRPKTPPPEEKRFSPPSGSNNCFGGRQRGNFHGSSELDFDVESFQSHREQLLEMQREQQQKLFTEDDHDTSITLDLQPTPTPDIHSNFFVDSASAEFAVRALVDSSNLGTLPVLEGATPGSVNTAAASPVGSRTNLQQFSFSLISKASDSTGTIGTNGKTLNSSLSSGKVSQADNSVVAKLPLIANTVLSSSSSISLLHKSPSAPVLPQVTQSLQSVTTSLPSTVSLLSSPSAILLPHKTNGPLSSSHVKSSGLSTSPAANVLQLNFPANTSLITSSSLIVSSPAVIAVAPSSSTTSTTPVTTSTTGNTALQLQRPLNNKVTNSAGNLYKLPVSATPASNYDILRSNHEEMFNKDTGIPMDVT